MKLKEKLAEEYGSKKECCCGNSGCGGTAQESAYLAGFEKAKEMAAEIVEGEGPFGLIHSLGEEEVE